MVNVKEKLAHTSEYYTNFFSVYLSNNIRISAEIAIELFAAVFILILNVFRNDCHVILTESRLNRPTGLAMKRNVSKSIQARTN